MTATTYNIHDYHSIPALRDYIDRIEADQLNFRRFMVRVWSGHYYHERVLINLDKDGTIRVSDKSFAPSDSEQAAIKTAFTTINFPTVIGANETLMEML